MPVHFIKLEIPDFLETLKYKYNQKISKYTNTQLIAEYETMLIHVELAKAEIAKRKKEK